MSLSTNKMSTFTEFATKPDCCRSSLNNKIMDSDKGNNYVSGLDDRIINGVQIPLMLNNKFAIKF